MPIKPLKPKKRRGLTEDQRMYLLNGWCLDSRDGRDPRFPFKDEDHQKTLWFEHRDELMANCNIPYKQRQSFIDLNRFRIRPHAFYEYEVKRHPAINGGQYKSEIRLLEKMGLVTDRDRELVREIEAAEAEYFSWGNASPGYVILGEPTDEKKKDT